MELQELLKTHRSIRKYKKGAEVPLATIAEIVGESMAGGSSSGNLNTYSVIVTADAARKTELWKLHSQQDFILDAACVLTICADHHRNRQWLESRDARDGFNNFLGYHVAAYDAMILAQNIALSAQNRGLGICYMGTTLYVTAELRRFLELPDTVFPVTSLVIGVPDEDPRKRDRMPVSTVLHEETYRATRADDIDAMFGAKEAATWARYRSNPETIRLMAEHGITNPAQFYTSKIKYGTDEQEQLARELHAELKTADFLPRN